MKRMIKEHIDLARLWQIARKVDALETLDLEPGNEKSARRVRLAVAYDEAFCFYYQDNFDILRAAGAELIFFSPLHDDKLPDNINGLYLGGGYPELYAAQLSQQKGILEDIQKAHKHGMPIYAECGGLMVLTQTITDLQGHLYPMCGVIPGNALLQSHLSMGYRLVTAEQDTLLLKRGEQTRGHEFHYSTWEKEARFASPAYSITSKSGHTETKEGYVSGNLCASYVHLHFGSVPHAAQRFVDACASWTGNLPQEVQR